MKQSPLLAFESTAFPVAPGEDEHTNPGIFGKALAEWLAQELRAQGLGTDDVIPEDFGWCVRLASKPHRLYVACASVDDSTSSWRVFVFAEGGLVSRIFGSDRSAESVAEAFTAVRDVLAGSPDVTRLHEEPAA